jgi:hypothetical protein
MRRRRSQRQNPLAPPRLPGPGKTAQQAELATDEAKGESPTKTPKDQTAKKLTWPKTLQAQIRAVRDQLATGPMDAPTLATRFKRKPEKSVSQVLFALTGLGMVGEDGSKQFRLREG